MYELDLKKILDCLPEKYDSFDIERGLNPISLVSNPTKLENIWCDLTNPAMRNTSNKHRYSQLYLHLHSDKVVLRSIVVTKKYQGNGYGTAVIRELIEQCVQRKLSLHIYAAGKPVRGIAHKLSAEFHMNCSEVCCKKDKCWHIDIK